MIRKILRRGTCSEFVFSIVVLISMAAIQMDYTSSSKERWYDWGPLDFIGPFVVALGMTLISCIITYFRHKKIDVQKAFYKFADNVGIITAAIFAIFTCYHLTIIFPAHNTAIGAYFGLCYVLTLWGSGDEDLHIEHKFLSLSEKEKYENQISICKLSVVSFLLTPLIAYVVISYEKKKKRAVQDYMTSAWTYQMEKPRDRAGAIFQYSKVLEIDPTNEIGENASAYSGRANLYGEQGDYARAIADFTAAICLEPDNEYYYERRAELYLEQKEYAQAISDYTKGIETYIAKYNEVPYYGYYKGRGIAYQKLGNTAEAEADFAKAKELETKNQ